MVIRERPGAVCANDCSKTWFGLSIATAARNPDTGKLISVPITGLPVAASRAALYAASCAANVFALYASSFSPPGNVLWSTMTWTLQSGICTCDDELPPRESAIYRMT